MFAVLCTEGQMQLQDVANECKKEKWVPLFVYRENGETVIPLFEKVDVVRSFIKKNFPNDWIQSAFFLNEDDLKKIKSKNWRIRKMDYPNKLKDIKNIQFDIEIFYLDSEPSLKVN